MNVSKKLYHFGKLMSGRPVKQLWVVWIGLGIIIAIALFCLWFDKGWESLGALFSPVPMYSVKETHVCPGIRFFYLLCYLVGTIVFSGVIIAIFTNFIRTAGERYVNGTAYYPLGDHILFLGYDEMMIGTLRKELADNPDADIVVAVPADAASVRNTLYQYLTNEQSKRVIVILASRVKVDDLEKAAYVQTAKRIYIIGQADEETHDAINLKCVGFVAGLCASLDIKPQCMYYMRNQATFSMIQRQGITAKDLMKYIASVGLPYVETSIDDFIMGQCESFNFYEIASRRLLFNMKDYENSMKLDWYSATKNLNSNPDLQPHLVILGMTEMGTALAREVLMTVHYPNKKLKITFVDDNAYEETHYFIGKYKSFFDNCRYTYRNLNKPELGMEIHEPENGDFLDVEFEFLKCDVAHPKMHETLLEWAKDKEKLLTIVACTNDTPKNMAFALYLRRPILENVPIWVYQKRDDSMNPFIRHNIYGNIRTFSLNDIGVATPDAPEYTWAKAIAEAYDKNYGGHKSWREKSSGDRWSSLYNALSLIIKIRLAGYGLTVSDNGELNSFNLNEGKSPISLTDEQVKIFSIVEHNRWNSEKLMMGFKPSSEEQHKALAEGKITSQSLKDNFIHDDIRAFEDLEQEEQEKDYVLTRAIVDAINKYEPHTM